MVLWPEPHRRKGETHYGTLGDRLGGEKWSGRGGHPYLGVGGCEEAAVHPHDGKCPRCSLILDEDGVLVLLRSKHELGKLQELRRSFLAWRQGSGGRDFVRHQQRVSEEDGGSFGAPKAVCLQITP
jgi:hypothetical protein